VEIGIALNRADDEVLFHMREVRTRSLFPIGRQGEQEISAGERLGRPIRIREQVCPRDRRQLQSAQTRDRTQTPDADPLILLLGETLRELQGQSCVGRG
jgi:hypothetical protein